MGNVRIATGDIETLQTQPLQDKYTGDLKIGLTNIKAKLRRISDGFMFDWNDDTFKAAASVVQKLETLSEVDATNFPGEYSAVFDTSAIQNPTDDDTYEVTVVEDGTEDVGNLPQVGEVRVGHWVDTVLVATDAYQVYQNYAYDRVADIFTGVVWVEHNNDIVLTGTSAVVELYDADSNLMFPAITDAVIDSQGVFKVSRSSPPGLLPNAHYYTRASVVIPDVGTVRSNKGIFTVG